MRPAGAERLYDLEAVEPGFSPRELRDAFGRFATGVTVVTALHEGRPIGLTVNSFASVSLDPPLLLFSLDRRAACLPLFERADTFVVNVLGTAHQDLAARFATRLAERFTEEGWSEGALGAPVLAGAVAAFECHRHAVHDGGDHRIFLGRVAALRFGESADPLVVFQGGYHSL